MSVQQTLGGAWIDTFGPGIATINISGHTGWRTGAQWEAEFKKLREVAFTGWHAAVEASKDPEKEYLQFVDVLDSRCVYVVPLSFSLKRNKNRPLLAMYNISFSVIRDAGSAGSGGASSVPTETPGGTPPASSQTAGGDAAQSAAAANKTPLQKFNDTLSSVKKLASKVSSAVNVAKSIMSGDLGSLTATLGAVFGRDVADAVGGLTSLANDAMSIAADVGSLRSSSGSDSAARGASAPQSAAQQAASASQAATLPASVSTAAAALSGASGAALSHLMVSDTVSLSVPQTDFISRLISLLREAMRHFMLDFKSDTGGGESLSSLLSRLDDETNPFDALSPSGRAYFVQSADAATATLTLLRSDCVMNPLHPDAVASLARRIVAGTRINGDA